MTYPDQPYPPSHHARPTSNGLATAGFVVALVGAIFSVIPVVGTVSWIISPVGFVLSAVGLVLYRSRRCGRGLAIAGLLLGVFGVIMCIAYTASFVNAVSTPAPNAAPASPAPNADSPAQPTTGHYGDPLPAGDVTVTASAPKKVSTALGSALCSTVTYRNTGSDQQPYNLFDWKFRTANGTETGPGISGDSAKGLGSGQLNPGGNVSGQVCADSTVTSASALVYSGGFLGGSQLVWSK